MIAEALARDGHTTEVATNGAMALDMLGRRAYDLVVSDTKMPMMDGEAFFAEAARRFPALARRFVFLTGDVLSREKREFLERAGAPFLTKPCDLAEMRQLIRRLADDLPAAAS
jgi:CheY-like chemotaxis protein